MQQAEIIVIGYSGHAYVVCDIFLSKNRTLKGYCDVEEKSNNPFGLRYLGPETDAKALTLFNRCGYFVAVGQNLLRSNITGKMTALLSSAPENAIHPSAVIARSAKIGSGVIIAANATVNPLANIADGTICNTGCVIEHECKVGAFAHIAPGAVLAGNVIIGERSFIGANSIIKQGVKIGNNVTVGAGSVVLRDLPDGITVVGNPACTIKL